MCRNEVLLLSCIRTCEHIISALPVESGDILLDGSLRMWKAVAAAFLAAFFAGCSRDGVLPADSSAYSSFPGLRLFDSRIGEARRVTVYYEPRDGATSETSYCQCIVLIDDRSTVVPTRILYDTIGYQGWLGTRRTTGGQIGLGAHRNGDTLFVPVLANKEEVRVVFRVVCEIRGEDYYIRHKYGEWITRIIHPNESEIRFSTTQQEAELVDSVPWLLEILKRQPYWKEIDWETQAVLEKEKQSH